MLLLSSVDFFQNKLFFKKFFQERNQSVKQFGSRSGRHNVGPDLGPNCLQVYQQTTKIVTNKERVNMN